MSLGLRWRLVRFQIPCKFRGGIQESEAICIDGKLFIDGQETIFHDLCEGSGWMYLFPPEIRKACRHRTEDPEVFHKRNFGWSTDCRDFGWVPSWNGWLWIGILDRVLFRDQIERVFRKWTSSRPDGKVPGSRQPDPLGTLFLGALEEIILEDFKESRLKEFPVSLSLEGRRI